MPSTFISDYFYGDEAEQFQFFRIPRQLITNPKFKHLSTDAKLLYGMLLDRMSLSVKSGWHDEDGRVYIYYTVDEICTDLNCGVNKAIKLLAELDTGKGVGLIERVKQGQGKPAKIYVKRFTVGRHTAPADPVPQDQKNADLDFSKVQTFNFQNSRPLESTGADLSKRECSYNNINHTELIHTYPSISPLSPRAPEMDRCGQRERLKEKIEFEVLQKDYPFDDVESILELMTDVLCSTARTVRIGGEELPVDTVKKRFAALEREHIEYVIDSLRQTSVKINNIRAYLLTALYNAPVTIGPYYSAALRHDRGGK